MALNHEDLHHARRFSGPHSAPVAPPGDAYGVAYRRWMRAHKLLGLAAALYGGLLLIGLGQGGRLADMPGVELGFWSSVALLPLLPAVVLALLALKARPLGLALLGLHATMLVLFVAFGALSLFLWAAAFLPL